ASHGLVRVGDPLNVRVELDGLLDQGRTHAPPLPLPSGHLLSLEGALHVDVVDHHLVVDHLDTGPAEVGVRVLRVAGDVGGRPGQDFLKDPVGPGIVDVVGDPLDVEALAAVLEPTVDDPGQVAWAHGSDQHFLAVTHRLATIDVSVSAPAISPTSQVKASAPRLFSSRANSFSS